MRHYRWHAAAVLLLILVHTRVTVLPGWQVPVLPLLLVTAAAVMSGALCLILRPSRPRTHYRRAVPAGGTPWDR